MAAQQQIEQCSLYYLPEEAKVDRLHTKQAFLVQFKVTYKSEND